MQIKLHRWASEDPACRFGDLFNLVYDPAFLMHAWERVSGNAGARTPGVDRATVAQIVSRVGVEAFLGHVRDLLKAGEFEPVEVRRVVIPKASGKLRKLGIPTVADRVVQASLKAVLEPIFEADFKPCSYGFRPRRRAQDAIAEIHLLASHSFAADAGRIANEAGVKRLVLNHLIPADDPEIGEADWEAAVRKSWAGDLTIARDGLVVNLDGAKAASGEETA